MSSPNDEQAPQSLCLFSLDVTLIRRSHRSHVLQRHKEAKKVSKVPNLRKVLPFRPAEKQPRPRWGRVKNPLGCLNLWHVSPDASWKVRLNQQRPLHLSGAVALETTWSRECVNVSVFVYENLSDIPEFCITWEDLRIRESVLSNDLSICPGIELSGATISDDSFQSAADPSQISLLTTGKIPPEARLASYLGGKTWRWFFFFFFSPDLPLLSLALCFIIPEANNQASISSCLIRKHPVPIRPGNRIISTHATGKKNIIMAAAFWGCANAAGHQQMPGLMIMLWSSLIELLWDLNSEFFLNLLWCNSSAGTWSAPSPLRFGKLLHL